MIAAPAMKPIRVAFERKSIINPSLQFKPKKKKKTKPAISTTFHLGKEKTFFLGVERYIEEEEEEEEERDHLNNPKEAWKRPAKKVEEKAS